MSHEFYDASDAELRDPLPPGAGEPEPGTRIPNDTCAACGYPRQLKPLCPHCGLVAS